MNNKLIFYNTDGEYLFQWNNKPIEEALKLKAKWLKENLKLLVMVYDYELSLYYELRGELWKRTQ